MIIEYLNESTDILASKVENEEITMEAAIEAYNDIADKAINEYVSEILDAVDEDIITATEASLILEMAGITQADIYTEADYDLSGLSKKDRKAVEDKLASMAPDARKKAEKALAKQYPSEEYKAKVAKRKKILAGVGTAAAVGTAAGLAYGAHKFKQAENIALNTDKAYDKTKADYAKKIEDLDNSTLVGAARKLGKEGDKAREKLDAMRPSDRKNLEADYAKKAAEAGADYAKGVAEIKAKKKERQGTLGYIKNTLKQAREVKKIDKDLAKRLAANKADENEEREWAKARKKKTLGIKFKNLFRKDEDKLYDPGLTDKGIEKKLSDNYAPGNETEVNNAEKAKKDVYKKKK